MARKRHNKSSTSFRGMMSYTSRSQAMPPLHLHASTDDDDGDGDGDDDDDGGDEEEVIIMNDDSINRQQLKRRRNGSPMLEGESSSSYRHGNGHIEDVSIMSLPSTAAAAGTLDAEDTADASDFDMDDGMDDVFENFDIYSAVAVAEEKRLSTVARVSETRTDVETELTSALSDTAGVQPLNTVATDIAGLQCQLEEVRRLAMIEKQRLQGEVGFLRNKLQQTDVAMVKLRDVHMCKETEIRNQCTDELASMRSERDKVLTKIAFMQRDADEREIVSSQRSPVTPVVRSISSSHHQNQQQSRFRSRSSSKVTPRGVRSDGLFSVNRAVSSSLVSPVRQRTIGEDIGQSPELAKSRSSRCLPQSPSLPTEAVSVASKKRFDMVRHDVVANTTTVSLYPGSGAHVMARLLRPLDGKFGLASLLRCDVPSDLQAARDVLMDIALSGLADFCVDRGGDVINEGDSRTIVSVDSINRPYYRGAYSLLSALTTFLEADLPPRTAALTVRILSVVLDSSESCRAILLQTTSFVTSTGLLGIKHHHSIAENPRIRFMNSEVIFDVKTDEKVPICGPSSDNKSIITEVGKHYGKVETDLGSRTIEVLCHIVGRGWWSDGTSLDDHLHAVDTATYLLVQLTREAPQVNGGVPSRLLSLFRVSEWPHKFIGVPEAQEGVNGRRLRIDIGCHTLQLLRALTRSSSVTDLLLNGSSLPICSDSDTTAVTGSPGTSLLATAMEDKRKSFATWASVLGALSLRPIVNRVTVTEVCRIHSCGVGFVASVIAHSPCRLEETMVMPSGKLVVALAELLSLYVDEAWMGEVGQGENGERTNVFVAVDILALIRLFSEKDSRFVQHTGSLRLQLLAVLSRFHHLLQKTWRHQPEKELLESTCDRLFATLKLC